MTPSTSPMQLQNNWLRHTPPSAHLRAAPKTGSRGAARGHQFTDDAGRFQLTTVVPGLYPGPTEHIHVKMQAPNGPVLTTRLFFPGVQSNESDSIFDPALVMTIQEAGDGEAATFDFVVSAP